MVPELYKVSVPGSMMLMGEHAVLHGHQAIVCAVQQRLRIQLIPNASQEICISDTRLGTMKFSLDSIEIQPPFKFVIAAILLFKAQLPHGFELQIESEFSSVLGLGSSAAVTIATLAVLNQWLNSIPLSNEVLLRLAKQVLLRVQGRGSGADLAASLYGGVIAYKLDAVDQLPIIPNLTAIYCGYKTPTPQVIALIEQAQAAAPQKFAAIFAAMHKCALEAINAIKAADWAKLGTLFTQHHALQGDLGTSNELLEELVQKLKQHNGIYGAKISGAGLGDCVIGLGTASNQLVTAENGIQQFPINIDAKGLIYADN